MARFGLVPSNIQWSLIRFSWYNEAINYKNKNKNTQNARENRKIAEIVFVSIGQGHNRISESELRNCS